MKKIYFTFILIAISLLSACQSPAEDGRESVLEIYNAHEEVEFEVVSMPEDFYYGGFSSYTRASDHNFKLILLRDDIYSELLIEWDGFVGEKVRIESIQMNYYNFAKEQFLSIESEEENGLLFEGLTYTDTLKKFSSIRIEDIQWIIESLGYEIQ
ncbi:MAG: hypothetical protein ACOC2U_03970 [bacterium]